MTVTIKRTFKLEKYASINTITDLVINYSLAEIPGIARSVFLL